MKITLHHQKFILKTGTKTVYELNSEETKAVTLEQHKNAVDAAPWFRRLGGSETLTREYTKQGYQVTQIVSKSPDRQTKVIRKYKFQ
jgi:spore coat polysaccharide biosynthesis predicted glycosyltransferase SpsG